MSAPAVELAGITKNFGRTEIIRGVDLSIPIGERHAVIGPNGAGKSTLFNLISGRLAPSTGTIRLKGEDVTGFRPYEINRRGLSRSFQVTNIFPHLSCGRTYGAASCGRWAANIRSGKTSTASRACASELSASCARST